MAGGEASKSIFKDCMAYRLAYSAIGQSIYGLIEIISRWPATSYQIRPWFARGILQCGSDNEGKPLGQRQP